MEFRNIREEKTVCTFIDMLRKGNHKKATVKLGQLKGSPEAFMNFFNYLTQGSDLQNARIKIKPIRARVRCLSCDWKGDPQIKTDGVECPRCRSDVEVLNGHEFQVQF
jgi:Zn finger protein HypA/HybF involved in hydrogenase expression